MLAARRPARRARARRAPRARRAAARPDAARARRPAPALRREVDDDERLLVAPLVAGDEQLGILCCLVRGRALRRRGRRAAARRGQPDRGRAEEGRADRAADRREHRQGHVRGARRRLGRRRPRPRRARRAATSAARTRSSTSSAPRERRRRAALAGARRARAGAPAAALPARVLRRRATTACGRSLPLAAGGRDGLDAARAGLRRARPRAGARARAERRRPRRRRARGGACARRPTRRASAARWPAAAARSSTSSSAPTATSSTSSSTRRRTTATARRSTTLIDYDPRRNAQLVETLERYLGARCSVAASARALYIHPNTVRQRLERIERSPGWTCARRTCSRSSWRSRSRGCTARGELGATRVEQHRERSRTRASSSTNRTHQAFQRNWSVLVPELPDRQVDADRERHEQDRRHLAGEHEDAASAAATLPAPRDDDPGEALRGDRADHPRPARDDRGRAAGHGGAGRPLRRGARARPARGDRAASSSSASPT